MFNYKADIFIISAQVAFSRHDIYLIIAHLALNTHSLTHSLTHSYKLRLSIYFIYLLSNGQ